MNQSQISNKDLVKFPKIPYKSKSLPINNKDKNSSLQQISAKAWLYVTPNSQYAHKSSAKRQIASLTKVMTAICTIELCDKYQMNLKTTYFKVTSWATTVIGTSAQLTQNAWMTVQDLLYGLMLPSGNDAATVLAQNIGAVVYFDKSGNKSLINEIRSIDLTQDSESIYYYNQQFIQYMNNKAKSLRMTKTRFANPHGLDHINNYSTCEDVYIMCKEFMKYDLLKKIAKTITHKGCFKFLKDGKVILKAIFWTNTNKLLEKSNIIGIKTGITNKAGGCLATLFKIDKSQGYIIVLGSNSTDNRFKDTLRIMNWAEDEVLTQTS